MVIVECAPRARRKLAARRTSRRRRSRGQAMVEFALVAPVFFLMFFGVLEYALISSSITTFNFAAQDGARIGSILGRTDATVDQQIVNDIVGRTSGFVVAKAQLIEIYRSDVAGSPPPSSGAVEMAYPPTTGSACSVCNWAVASRNDSLLNADYLGVRITYVYNYLTAFLSGGASQLQLSAISVQRIEPQSYQGYRPHLPAMLSSMSHQAPASSCATTGPLPVLSSHDPAGGGASCPIQPVAWLRERVPGVLAHSIGGAA
ncbi:MAG TPA: TadE/TadG family type IV pilus assembly protein [Ktedonobacterales bacterium]